VTLQKLVLRSDPLLLGFKLLAVVLLLLLALLVVKLLVLRHFEHLLFLLDL